MDKWIFPSDARSFIECKRKVWFDRHPPKGISAEKDPFDELLAKQGLAHEQRVKEKLGRENKLVEANSYEHTQELIEQKIPIIYQPKLRDKKLNIMGDPDFLILNSKNEYQPVDAKLATTQEKHDEIQIQLGIYRKLLNTKLSAIVYLGNGNIEQVGNEVNDKANKFIDEMTQLLIQKEKPLVHYSSSKCNKCAYLPLCMPEFKEKEDLTLLYGVEARAAKDLEKKGIKTIKELSEADPDDLPKISFLPDNRRAVFQAKAYFTNKYYVLNPIQLRAGTYIHFDIEANPLTEDGENQVYLWGFLLPPYGKNNFEYLWSDSPQSDKEIWFKFIQKIKEYRAKFDDFVLAHYSPYEKTWVTKYAERYGSLEDPTIKWLLDEKRSPFYDLFDVVKAGLVLPLSSYGLKAICKAKNLVNFQWQQEESGSQWSVVQYLEYLNESNPLKKEAIKNSIILYNYDDVLAMEKLKIWISGLA